MFSGGFQFGATATQATQGFAATQSDVKKARPDEKQQVLPVTVRSIEHALLKNKGGDADTLSFYADAASQGCEPAQLVVVGQVEKLSMQATSVECTINDGTGRMKARYFFNDTESSEDAAKSIEEGMYVSGVGAVRTMPQAHLGLIVLRPVASADEVSYHMIECAHAAMRILKGPQASSGGYAPTQQAPVQQPTSTPTFASPVKEPAPRAVNSFSAAPSDPAKLKSVSTVCNTATLQASVMDIVRSQGEAAGDMGVSISQIVAALKAKDGTVGEPDVRKVLESLVENADLFATVDDDHFQAL